MRRWLRFPFVLATIGGAAMLGVGGLGSLHSIRFAAGGVITHARVLTARTEIIGVWTGLTTGRFHAIRSRRVDYEFEGLDGKTHVGSDGWNGRKLGHGDLLDVQFMRADPESNRIHPDYGADWLGNLLFLVGGAVVLAIPRFSKPHSKREEWNDFERELRAATKDPRHRASGSLPTSGKVLAFLGCIAAFFMTAWAALCVVVTVTTNDYRQIVALAAGWAMLSLLLLLAAWSRLERGSRSFALVIAVADVAVLFAALARWIGVN